MQYLSKILSSINKKDKQHWGWVKKSVANKKKGVFEVLWISIIGDNVIKKIIKLSNKWVKR